MIRFFQFVRSSFEGLSAEVWWLALVTFINRAGSMIIPFLSLYLTKDQGFSLSQVGWVMTAFGLGSVIGSWAGGWLTDRFGNYKVMSYSLLLTGLGFIALQWVHGFWWFCLAIFIITTWVDSFRPAIFVALDAYSKPENRTRSVTLIRLAINLGFSAGPAIGGWIIVSMGYSGLFWVDGITCLLAVLILWWVLNPRRARSRVSETIEEPAQGSPYKDGPYLLFCVALVLFGIAFMQYFSTIPIFYKDVYELSEQKIGLLLGLNGLLIFIFEMPMVKWLENLAGGKMRFVIVGAVLLAMSFLVLNLPHWMGVLVIGMLLMTYGEIIAFPFSNSFAMERSQKGKKGAYMALYSLSFSFAAIIGHNLGMQTIDRFGFTFTWYMIAGLVVASVLLFVSVDRRLKAESS